MTLLFIVRMIGGHSHMTEVRDCSAEARVLTFAWPKPGFSMPKHVVLLISCIAMLLQAYGSNKPSKIRHGGKTYSFKER
jgi:hypothetical protein